MPDQHRYKCVRCGRCCRWPGVVRLRPGEPERIARYLDLPVEEFVDRFTVLGPDRRCLVLIDRDDGACIFLEGDNHCRIYPVRPEQCRGFPNRWNFPGFEQVCQAIDTARHSAENAPAPRSIPGDR